MYCHNTEWQSEAWSLGYYSTVFQAELDAIGKLTTDLCKRNITNTEVIIHCDSKATIMSLEMVTVSSKTVLNTRTAVSDLLNQGNTVTICWVPGHVDVLGNERADELTKLGSTAPLIGAEPALPLPQCCIVSAVWQGASEAHARAWGMMQTGQFTHGLLPVPNKKLTSNLLILNRAGIRMVTRMLTLHNGLNDHMHRIGRRPSLLCSKCGEGRETPSHLFENCVSLAAIKYSIFGSTTTTLEEVVRGGRLCELLRFISRAALCC